MSDIQNTSTVWSVALALFLIANPIGNIPVFVSVVKDFEFHRQIKILFRESLFSFLIAVFFLYLGEPFLTTIHIAPYALNISGGILLFLVAISMIFPSHSAETKVTSHEPFIVPIATPLIAGGGVLTSILFYAAKEKNYPKVTLAVCIAWVGVTAITVSSAYLQKFLGQRGLLAMEQLMGMILTMIGVQIIVRGATLFFNMM